jgi:tetratricopeptide (TPR) repeat protein
MKKIILSLIMSLMFFSLFCQDRERKTEKEIMRFYYDATDDYFFHEYDSAIYKLDILDFLYEENANIKYFLGMCYFFKSDFEKAIKYFKQSEKDVIYTNDYQNGIYSPHVMYFYLGFASEKQGNIQDAIKYYEKYIEYEKKKEIIFNIEDRIEIIKLLHKI